MMRRRGRALRRHFGHFGGRGEVIPSRIWRHRSGAGASPYGAVPWTGAPGNRKEDWHMEDMGWTIQWSDGTVGIGRQPFTSKDDAEDWLRRHEERLSEARKIQEKYARRTRKGR